LLSLNNCISTNIYGHFELFCFFKPNNHACCRPRLGRAIQRRDVADLKAAAHKLRGGSLTCGFVAIADPLATLERIDQEQIAGAAPGLLTRVKDALQRTRQFLQHLEQSGKP